MPVVRHSAGQMSRMLPGSPRDDWKQLREVGVVRVLAGIHQRTPARSMTPCSRASSLAGSRRVASRLRSRAFPRR